MRHLRTYVVTEPTLQELMKVILTTYIPHARTNVPVNMAMVHRQYIKMRVYESIALSCIVIFTYDNLNARDPYYSLLDNAVAGSHTAVVALLLSAGVDPRSNGHPIRFAVSNKSGDIIRLLVAAGVDTWDSIKREYGCM